jgi:hypothetical protein
MENHLATNQKSEGSLQVCQAGNPSFSSFFGIGTLALRRIFIKVNEYEKNCRK